MIVKEDILTYLIDPLREIVIGQLLDTRFQHYYGVQRLVEGHLNVYPGGTGNQTADPGVHRQLLFQLSYCCPKTANVYVKITKNYDSVIFGHNVESTKQIPE